MKNTFDYNFINKLIKYGSILLLSMLVLLIFYNIGILNLIESLINCLIPVLFAIFLSFFMEPIISVFAKKMKRRYAVLLSYFFLILLITLILFLILPSFILQLEVLINNLPNIIKELDFVIQNFLGNLGIDFHIGVLINDSMKEILPSVSQLISGVFSFITVVGIVFIGALYLSFDYPKFKEKIKKLLCKKHPKETLELLRKFEFFCYRYIYGILFDAFILWILASGGFYIVGLDYPIVFGFIVAIFDLIPYIGPIIGGAPAVIVALTVNTQFALIVLIIVLVSQFIESNITQPIILKSVISLHPIEGIIGILVLGTLFGFVGMIISPIIVTFIKLFIPYFNNIKYKREIENDAN